MRWLLGSSVVTYTVTALATVRGALIALVIFLSVVVLLALLSDKVLGRLCKLVAAIKAHPGDPAEVGKGGEADRGPRAA
jgi:hypothetical protein